MKIETSYDVGDEVFIIRTTNLTGCKYYYIQKQIIKEIGKDEKGTYINIGGVRSSLEQFNKKYFIKIKDAYVQLLELLKGKEYKECQPHSLDHDIVGYKYLIKNIR